MRTTQLIKGIIGVISALTLISLFSGVNWYYEVLSLCRDFGYKPAAAFGANDCCVAPYWQYKLVGKRFVDDGDSGSGWKTFSAKDLPKDYRIIRPDSVYTTDFVIERINVHVDKKGVCFDVIYG